MSGNASTDAGLRKGLRVFLSVKGSKSHRLELYGVFQDAFTSVTEVFLLNYATEVGKDDFEV